MVVSYRCKDLDINQQTKLVEYIKQEIDIYQKSKIYSSMPKQSVIDHLTKYIENAFSTKVMLVTFKSLVITLQCPTLESLEKLWNSYCSGCLNEIVERFLVTDELRRKLGLDNVRLTTTIEEENYLICKRAFGETSGEPSSLSLFFFFLYFISFALMNTKN